MVLVHGVVAVQDKLAGVIGKLSDNLDRLSGIEHDHIAVCPCRSLPDDLEISAQDLKVYQVHMDWMWLSGGIHEISFLDRALFHSGHSFVVLDAFTVDEPHGI